MAGKSRCMQQGACWPQVVVRDKTMAVRFMPNIERPFLHVQVLVYPLNEKQAPSRSTRADPIVSILLSNVFCRSRCNKQLAAISPH